MAKLRAGATSFFTNGMEKIDFLAVGDIVIDAFIELEDAEVNCDINKENCKICMRFADKIPYKDVTVVKAVGNSPNAAVSSARLDLKTALVTHVGDDQNGKDCIETLKENGVETDLVQTDAGFKTNYHYVLQYQVDRTILIKHEAYPYDFEKEIGEVMPSWIYLSSVGDNTLPYHEQIADFLEKNPDVKLAFQPGTFQMKMGPEKLSRLYKRTEIHFCNKEEAERILNGGRTSDRQGPTSTVEEIKVLLQKIAELGPKIAVITDGPNGAYAYDGQKYFEMPIYPDPKPPLERTGAGDAFSSTVTAALAIGKTLEEALAWGPVNSMSVVQYVGAQEGLLARQKLESLLSEAPSDYKIKEI